MLNEETLRQAGTIAVRRSGDAVEVCVIRRKGSQAWGIPKGFVDPGDTPEEAALKEAWEEAGLKGRLMGNPVGSYEYEKRGADFTVAVYVMEVLEAESDWPEADLRDRRWVSWDEAASLLADHPVRPLVDRARQRTADGA